jgi:NAD(P)-dependent dehydrogenase (short-subunit alcohol dehydrogenase family)
MSQSKTILITGVSRGLGRAMTEKFIEAGHVVIGCGRSASHMKELSEKFSKPNRFDSIDVTSDKEVKSWSQSVSKTNQPPDFLINNAALINRNAFLWNVPVSEFSDVIDVNIKGVTNVIRHFVPLMLPSKKGVIINISSGWGKSTAPEVAPYCTTKWAIEGLSQALSQELPTGMASIALSPGVINTDMLRTSIGANSYQKPKEWAKKAVPFILNLNARNNGMSMSIS